MQEGLLPVRIMLTVPAYTELPGIGHGFRVYRNPENESQISTLPEVTDVEFDHLGLLALAGLAIVGAVGCGIGSWRHRTDGPVAPVRKRRPFGWHPGQVRPPSSPLRAPPRPGRASGKSTGTNLKS